MSKKSGKMKEETAEDGSMAAEPAEGIATEPQAETQPEPQAETQPETRTKKSKRRDKKARSEKKRLSGRSKAIIILCSLTVFLIGVYVVCSAFFKDAKRNVVDLNYGSVSTEVREGEVYSLSKVSEYDGIDIFGRLNWKFSHQTKWYSEMHSSVDTIMDQNVETYKQYSDGILISAELTKGFTSSANQYCYLKEKDRVLWRKAAGGPSTYNGLDTEWQTGNPDCNMAIGGEKGFKALNGLPDYELSVYVIEPKTVKSASDVTEVETGVFSITYELNPEPWENDKGFIEGATAYYSNQMIFTGGLSETPKFEKISVTFKFNENWEVLETDIHEEYHAAIGPISAPCVSDSVAKFEYNTSKAESNAYKEYFSKYEDDPLTDTPAEHELTALDCLAEAFGDILTEPTVLDVRLDVNGTPIDGVIDLDLSKADFSDFQPKEISAKVGMGDLQIWVEDGNVYLSYGGVKLQASMEEVMTLFAPPAQSDEKPAEEGILEDLLSALAGGEFSVNEDKTEAKLHSDLSLAGLSLRLDISFTLGESIGFGQAVAAITLDGQEITATIEYGNESLSLPSLTEAEKTKYVKFTDYIGALLGLANEQNLTFTLNGTVTSTDAAYEASNGVKYSINATLGLYAGETFPLHLETDAKSFYVNSDLYLHATVNVTASLDTDDSFYLDVFILDAAPAAEEGGEAVKDGTLDLYVSVSTFKPDDEGRNPLNIYAPADEIMRLLSGICTIAGLDTGIIDEYMVSYWLEKEAAVQGRPLREQLRALGGALLPLIGGLIGGETSPASLPAPAPMAQSDGYIKRIEVEENGMVIVLNSAAIYGMENLADITVTVSKTTTNEKSLISAVKLENVYDPTGAEKYDFELTIKPTVERAEPAGDYYSFPGLEELLYAVAKSATHEVTAEEAGNGYALNNNFYIDGDINATFNLPFLNAKAEISISLAVSVTVEESGKLGVNIHLDYQGVKSSGIFSMILINGDSCVDIAIKDGMVYMKRVQTSVLSGSTEKEYETPVTEYRATTMEEFMGNISDNLGFILNLSKTVLSFLPKGTTGGEEPAEPAPEGTPAAKKDIGTKFDEVFRSYDYTVNKDDGSKQWALALDGTSFSNGILAGLNGTLKADAEGYLRDIEIEASLLKDMLPITCTLRWRNAGGTFEEGSEDKTDASFVEEVDWTQYTFFEGRPTQIGFYDIPCGGERAIIETRRFRAE